MSANSPYHSYLGGYSEHDGTIEFYLRIRNVLCENSVVLDLGAGRAAWYEDDEVEMRRKIRFIKPDVKYLYAIDVDNAVLENNASTENILYDGELIPLADSSVDVVVSDYVLEHVSNPVKFAQEIERVLKPGGHLCARTPHKYNYVSIGSRMVSNESHASLIGFIQPGRKDIDVFPTAYKINTLSDVNQYFKGWNNNSYIFRTDPSYYFDSLKIFKIASFFHRLLPIELVGNIFVFIQKPKIDLS